MSIKATRPGSGAAHPNVNGEGTSIEAHMAQAKSEGHMFASDVAISRWRQQQTQAAAAKQTTGNATVDAWDRAEASFPAHLRHGHIDEGY